MNRLALAGFALTIGSAGVMPAVAGGLPQAPAPAYDAVPASQQSIDWTGIYVGGELGWAFGNFDNSANGGQNDFNANGLGGGVYAGYNFQVTPNVVVGLETEFNLTDLEKRSSAGGLSIKSSSDWNAAFRGRLGYAFDRYLIYGAGGLALADLEASANGVKDSKTAVGWTLGAGAEAAVTNNVVARFDYSYQDFGDQNFNLGGSGVKSEFNNHQVRAGIAYKF